jgi:hypothetical protein
MTCSKSYLMRCQVDWVPVGALRLGVYGFNHDSAHCCLHCPCCCALRGHPTADAAATLMLPLGLRVCTPSMYVCIHICPHFRCPCCPCRCAPIACSPCSPSFIHTSTHMAKHLHGKQGECRHGQMRGHMCPCPLWHLSCLSVPTITLI